MSTAAGITSKPAARGGRWNATLLIGATLSTIFVAGALLSLIYTPADAEQLDPANSILPPGSPGHLLGTDYLGRDVVAQLMAGARNSLIVGAAAASLSLMVGAFFGLVAAGFGGVPSEMVMRGADILIAIPGIITALVLAATMGASRITTVIALTVFFIPGFARITRSAAVQVLGQGFVSSARLYGRRTWFILARHVVPNILPLIIVQVTLTFAMAVLVEASLSYLGVGIGRPDVSWGLLLIEAQAQVGLTSPLALWPGLAITLAVLGLNMLGDGLRDAIDPKLTRGRSR